MPKITRLIASFFLALIFITGIEPSAQAKLGESFATYQKRALKLFRFAGQTTTGNIVTYRYILVGDKIQEERVPKYAAGLTINTINGIIKDQTMLFRTGSNTQRGLALMVVHGLGFTFEALGMKLPEKKADADNQLKAFASAVERAYSGQAQLIHYPGYKGTIKIRRDSQADIVIEAYLDTPASQNPTTKSN
jgi:hypothetical protein